MSEIQQERCPHCGRILVPDERITYRFAGWATIVVVALISLMLLFMDLVDDGKAGSFSNRVDWSLWAIIGVWIFFLSVYLIRYQPNYTWLMVPLIGVLFSVFFVMIDSFTGSNTGYMGLDWAWYVISPILTFVVFLPIIARIARNQPDHYDRLEYFVEQLEEEQS